MAKEEEPGKYFVVKRDDFDQLLIDFSGHLNSIIGGGLNKFVSAEITDAVVIRRQDVFAGPAFDAYSNVIMAAVETIKYTAPSSDDLDQVLQKLQEIADYFHTQAELSAYVNKKLPD